MKKSVTQIMAACLAALLFAAGFAVCAVIAVVRHESAFSYDPLYMEGSNAFAQIVRIAVISPWAFIGFENISHFSEEYSFPVKKVRGILIWSVVITTLLYLFVSLLSVSAYPPEYESWLSYIRDMGNLSGIKAVPAFYAASRYLGQAGVAVLMLALFGVILTSLIGNLMALSRLLYAAGREGEAPRMLAGLNRRGVPATAVVTIVIVALSNQTISHVIGSFDHGVTRRQLDVLPRCIIVLFSKHIPTSIVTSIYGMTSFRMNKRFIKSIKAFTN